MTASTGEKSRKIPGAYGAWKRDELVETLRGGPPASTAGSMRSRYVENIRPFPGQTEIADEHLDWLTSFMTMLLGREPLEMSLHERPDTEALLLGKGSKVIHGQSLSLFADQGTWRRSASDENVRWFSTAMVTNGDKVGFDTPKALDFDVPLQPLVVGELQQISDRLDLVAQRVALYRTGYRGKRIELGSAIRRGD